MTSAEEEILGAVLSVIGYSSEDEAVDIANGTPYGLAAGVWSADQEHAVAVGRRLRAGQVEVNGGGVNVAAPVRGFGPSCHPRGLRGDRPGGDPPGKAPPVWGRPVPRAARVGQPRVRPHRVRGRR